jgi:predicted nucleic acid-binding protein
MILDTNAVSAIGFRDPAIRTIIAAQTALHLPVIVIGEYQSGIQNSTKRKEMEAWFTSFASHVSILEVRMTTAMHYANVVRELRADGKPIPMNDVWIAALAREHDLPVLSNDGHFDSVKNLRRTGW